MRRGSTPPRGGSTPPRGQSRKRAPTAEDESPELSPSAATPIASPSPGVFAAPAPVNKKSRGDVSFISSTKIGKPGSAASTPSIPSTPNSAAALDTPSIKPSRSAATRVQSTPERITLTSSSPPQATSPSPSVLTDSPLANTRLIQRSKSWTFETMFSPFFPVVPLSLWRAPDGEEEADDIATKQQNENKTIVGRTSTSDLTADETLESSEADPEVHEHEREIELLHDNGKKSSQETSAAELESAPATSALPSAYEPPAAYTLEAVEEVEVFDPFVFIRSLPPLDPDIVPSPLLPPKAKDAPRITLVLDLDETLVHCTTEMPSTGFDFEFPVVFGGVSYQVFARKRPFLEEFLNRVSTMFEVIVFTASQKVYANHLLNLLDPQNKLVHHRLFRDACSCVDGNYLKDLRVVGRDLAQTLIVDNSPQAFGYQLDNGVPIETWFEDNADRELMQLLPFLEQLVNVPDVRPLIREKFKLHERVAPR